MIYRLGVPKKEHYYLIDYVRPELPDGIEFGVQHHEYQGLFETLEPKVSGLGYDLLRAPMLPYWHIATGVKLQGNLKKLADIFSYGPHLYVSEKAKSLLESADSFDHQYSAVTIFDKKNNKVDCDLYYRLHVRRYLNIDSSDESIRYKEFLLCEQEKKFVPTLKKSQRLYDDVSSIPIWKHVNQDGMVYFGGDFFEKIKDELKAVGSFGLL